MNDTRLLISRYLDGELTDDEVAILAASLERDSAEVNVLVFTSFLHAQLLDWMDQSHERDRAASAMEVVRASQASDSDDMSIVSIAPRSTARSERPSAGKIRRRLSSLGLIAASLAIAASILTVAFVVGQRPVIVGQLTDAVNCKWHTAPAGMQVGTLLEAEQDLVLLEGTAVITFASGAKLHLEGPASVEILSPGEVRVINGHIAAKVPRQAIGFAIDTSLARIIDLGTAFTLSLDAEESFRLDVFEGLVEVKLNDRFGTAAQRPVRVAEIHAVKFDVRSADVAPAPFVAGSAMPF
jgi:hypothetical protein